MNLAAPNLVPAVRPVMADLAPSLIREVANAGLGRQDVLAFWFGESDEVTDARVRQAAVDALSRGETFYAHNMGLPELRADIARYVSRWHRPLTSERVVVTSSGVTALMLAAQFLVSPGDEVLVVTPVWPNLTAQPQVLGARVLRFPLQFREGAWHLDLEALCAQITPRTRALVVNAPNNPTGWTLSAAEIQALLAHCRSTGTWIVSDEVYERLYYDEPGVAPSFLDHADEQDRLLVVQSFSKSFLMTGWRLGWLVVPPAVADTLGALLEFNSSCAPVFVQRAAQTALALADELVPPLQQHLRTCRDTLIGHLQALPRVEVRAPRGGMYAFFRIDGVDDSLVLAKGLVQKAGLGLAPGNAFGGEGQGFLRWCFASKDLGRLHLGAERLEHALRSGLVP